MKKISVIMGIYNCADTLSDAIDCIVNQTYTDWELIMCDDGSKDNTFDIASEYQKLYPSKIKLLKNENNMGLNYTLNRCLSEAEGEYIARMDGDDLCSADRFEKQLSVFEKEKNIDIVSSNMSFFDENGTWGQTKCKQYPEKKDFIHGTPFCHAPCMVKREAYVKVGGYTEKNLLLRVEDYHLWLKMYAQGYNGKNIQECLYQMRDDRAAYKRRKFKYRINEAYVRILSVRKLKLPVYGYLFAIKPIIIGLMPMGLYNRLHKSH